MANLVEAINTIAVHLKQGQLEAAQGLCLRILEQMPNQPDTLHLLGLVYQHKSQPQLAITHIKKAIQLSHDHPNPDFHLNLGYLYKKDDQHEDAIEQYQKVLELDPHHAIALSNLGNVYWAKRDIPACKTACLQALAIDANLPQAHHNLANALKELAQLDDALTHLKTALQLRPNDPQTHQVISEIYLIQQNNTASEQAAGKAIALDPNFAQAYCYLGLSLKAQGQYDQAKQALEHCLALKPDLADVRMHLGALHNHMGETNQALMAYDKVIAQNPDEQAAHEIVMFTHHYLPNVDPQAHYDLHRKWGKMVESQLEATTFVTPSPTRLRLKTHGGAGVSPAVGRSGRTAAVNRHFPTESHALNTPSKKLRIGYVSPDFRTHAVAFFFEPILQAHGPQVQTFCYSQVFAPDLTTTRLQSYANHWRSTCGLSDQAVAHMIQQDQIDILVDLAGHTSGNRLGVFALQPASIQITYLGYPNTTGLMAMQYRLTDQIADPPDQPTPHVEKLVYLDQGISCFRPFDMAPPVNTLPATDHGYVTFGSLSNPAKINPFVIKLWSDVLHAVPNSKLLIIRDIFKGSVKKKFINAFLAQGINRQRLLIHDKATGPYAMFNYHQMDIALDPHPYAGHTTTCESLWMGVPVVTLIGKTMVTRMSASVLHQVALDDWVSDTTQNYIDLAAQKAADVQALASLRSTLRQRMANSALGQPKTFTAQLEKTYQTLWKNHCLQDHTIAA